LKVDYDMSLRIFERTSACTTGFVPPSREVFGHEQLLLDLKLLLPVFEESKFLPYELICYREFFAADSGNELVQEKSNSI
jgi:hypothetical protein